MATEQATESLKNVNSNSFFGKVPGAEQCALGLWRYGKSYNILTRSSRPSRHRSRVVKRDDAEILMADPEGSHHHSAESG